MAKSRPDGQGVRPRGFHSPGQVKVGVRVIFLSRPFASLCPGPEDAHSRCRRRVPPPSPGGAPVEPGLRPSETEAKEMHPVAFRGRLRLPPKCGLHLPFGLLSSS